MQNTINITPIIEAIITLIISILSVIVIPKIKSWLENKLTSEQITIAKEVISSAVQAIEQVYANVSGKNGGSKKKYVIEYAKEKLEKLGFTMSDREIEIYLEQAVLELNQNKNTENLK